MLHDVIKVVGEENIVQVVTDNTLNYKLAREILMEGRKWILWTHCATHCIDLIVENFENKLTVHRVTIEKARGITTFIYAMSMLIKCMQSHTNEKRFD